MPRNIFSFLLCITMCLLLAACGKGSDDTPQENASNSSAASTNSTSSTSSIQGGSSSSTAPNLPYSIDRTRHAIKISEGSDINFATRASVFVESINDGYAYISANASNAPMVSAVEVGNFFSADTAIAIDIYYQSTNVEPRAPGTYFGTIQLLICRDSACNTSHTAELEIIYTVSPSGPVEIDCPDEPGIIFADCSDPTWFGPYAWQIDLDNIYHFDYFSNNGSLLVDWSIIPAHHSNGETVIDVRYTDDSAKGQLNFISPLYWAKNETIDMRSFADGALEFDIYVESWGRHDQQLQFAVECGWPCGTGRIDLSIATTGEWHNFSYPVAELVGLGLDLSNVNVGFIIGSLEDIHAEGLHFALDNIRWTQGTEKANRPEVGSLVVAEQGTVISTSQLSFANFIWVLGAYVEGVEDEVFYSLDTQSSELVADFSANNDFNSEGVQRLFIYPVETHQLESGSYKESLFLRACSDSTCELEYANSPFEFEVIYSIAPDYRANANCEGELGDLFIDCFGPDWQELSTWESKSIGSVRRAYRIFNGDGSFGARWETLDLNDGLHEQVIDIAHGDNPYVTDYMHIVAAGPAEPPTTLDLSDYKDGKLELDVRALDWGESSGELVMLVECIYPCRSGEFDVTPQTLGEWQSFSFPVKDLIDTGLDITQVYIGLSIAPAQGNMAGAHYQLDNIRWIK